ncbi:MAG: DUF3999 family protein [Terriglobia bacterium]
MRRAALLVLSAAALVAAAAKLPPAWHEWRYSRPLTLPSTEEARLAQVTLPLPVYGRAAAHLGDLRLIDDTGQEAAYLVVKRYGGTKREWREARVLETSFVPDRFTQAIVDTGATGQPHNGVELETARQDFFTRAEVAVSDDARRWRILADNIPFFRLPAKSGSASGGKRESLQLSYPESRVRFLRVRIAESGERFPLQGAKVLYEVVEEAERARLEPRFVSRPDAPRRESWWQLDLGAERVPALEVRFSLAASAPAAFYRSVAVFAGDDGVHWTQAGRGEIRRTAEGDSTLTIAFNEARGRYWRVVVYDGDDPPLEGITPQLYAVPRHLVFQQQPRRSYRLLYANQRTEAPRYELARLADREEVAAAAAGQVGPEEENEAWVDPRPWSERHAVVLWVALGIAVVALAWLALRSLRPAT